MCNRHWRTLFKKQLLPVLINPQPTVNPLGQVVSIEPVKSAVIFLLVGDVPAGGRELWATVWVTAGSYPGNETK